MTVCTAMDLPGMSGAELLTNMLQLQDRPEHFVITTGYSEGGPLITELKKKLLGSSPFGF